MKRIFASGSLLMITLLVANGPVWAQAAGEWRDGEHAYQKICHYCHDTGVGPVLKGRKLDVDYIRYVVRHGQRAMPAFRPSELDAKDLARLARTIHDSPRDKK